MRIARDVQLFRDSPSSEGGTAQCVNAKHMQEQQQQLSSSLLAFASTDDDVITLETIVDLMHKRKQARIFFFLLCLVVYDSFTPSYEIIFLASLPDGVELVKRT